MRIIELEADQARVLFPDLAPYIADALRYDPLESTSVATILGQLGTGEMLCLLVADGEEPMAALVLQRIMTTHGEQIIHVLACAGTRMAEWIDLAVAKLDEIARRFECSHVSMAGRPGWARKLSSHGFKSAHVVMRREVPNVQLEDHPALAVR